MADNVDAEASQSLSSRATMLEWYCVFLKKADDVNP